MTEKEFLTLYKERRNLKSIREAKERLDSFWKALFDVLEEEEKVIIKDWGIFEKREVKPRKILNLATREMMVTEEKKVIKFRPRMKMIDKVNELNTLKRRNMNTREFVSYYKKLRKEQDETVEYEEAREEIEEIFNLIAEVIAMDEEVKFKNRGTFSLLKRKKRRIGSPTSKEVREIVPKKTIKFVQSKVLEIN